MTSCICPYNIQRKGLTEESCQACYDIFSSNEKRRHELERENAELKVKLNEAINRYLDNTSYQIGDNHICT